MRVQLFPEGKGLSYGWSKKCPFGHKGAGHEY